MEFPTPFRLSAGGQLLPFEFTPIRQLVKEGLLATGDTQQPEAMLEAIIGRNPDLIGLEEEDGWRAFHQCQLPREGQSTIRPDILFLSQGADVVVVEVKVDGNEELRNRSIIAQAIEYVACLRRLSPEDLVTSLSHARQGNPTPAVDTSLSWPDFVASLFPDRDADSLADSVLENLRVGRVEIVLACDKAPPGLREVVKSVVQAKLGDFELRVVELVPFRCADQLLLLPLSKLETETVQRIAISGGAAGQPLTVTTTPLEEVEARTNARRRDTGWTPEEFLRQVTGGSLAGTRNGQFLERLVPVLLGLQEEGVLEIEGARSSKSARLWILVAGSKVLRISTSPSIRTFVGSLQGAGPNGASLLEELTQFLGRSPKNDTDILPNILEKDPRCEWLAGWLRKVKHLDLLDT